MDPRVLGAAFRIALLILGTAVVMLPFQRAGSAEQVVTVLAAVVGLLFAATVLAMARIWSGRPPISIRDKTRRSPDSGRFRATPPHNRKAGRD